MARSLNQPKIKAADGTCRRDTPHSIAAFAATACKLVYDKPYFNFRTPGLVRAQSRDRVRAALPNTTPFHDALRPSAGVS